MVIATASQANRSLQIPDAVRGKIMTRRAKWSGTVEVWMLRYRTCRYYPRHANGCMPLADSTRSFTNFVWRAEGFPSRFRGVQLTLILA
jgi:hypothetical protein